MQILSFASPVLMFVRQNWLKLAAALVLIFILLKKDLSFNINLRSPVRPNQEQVQPSQQAKEEKTEERFTEHRKASPTNADNGSVELFELPVFGKGSKTRARAVDKLSAVSEEIKQGYLKRFTKVALSESDKFGIPASIILANGLLHSLAGTSERTQSGENHFAIRCSEDWKGDTIEQEGACYRQYDNAWTSFRDHSLYITTGKFSTLRKLEPHDYKAWAKALEKGKYSDEPHLSRQLLQVIDEFGLDRLDQ